MPSDEIMRNASRLCTETLYRTMMSSATITSALELPKVFPEFKETLFQSHMSGETLLPQVFSQVFSKVANFEPEFLPTIARGLAEQAAVNAETVISAAAIVLAHSRADEAFTTACGLGIDLAPQDWYSELSADRKIKLGDLRNEGAERILTKELESYKKKLGAKSLPSRAELLFRKVPIKLHKDIPPTEASYYRGSKLEDADDLRHEIIHGSVLPKISIVKSRAITNFLHEAAQTALRSVGNAFNVPLDMAYMQELAEKKRKL